MKTVESVRIAVIRGVQSSELKAAVALVAGGLELRPIDESLEIADGSRLAATELSSQ